MKPTTVFLSSTCFDLLDLRAELCAFIRDLGLDPVASDDPATAFDLLPGRTSIETCLVNVRSSDVFVCVLSQRYGPRLGNAGFENLSATHLEYRAAKATGRRVLLYVRDKTQAEFDIWRKDKGGQPAFRWVQGKDHGLFEIMEEHSALTKDGQDNWMTTFRTSVDLKAALGAHLRREAAYSRVRALHASGRLPHYHIASNGVERGPDSIGVALKIEPTEKTTLVHASCGAYGEEETTRLPQLEAGKTDSHRFQVPGRDLEPAARRFSLKVTTVSGTRIRYIYEVKRAAGQGAFSVTNLGLEYLGEDGLTLLGPGEALP